MSNYSFEFLAYYLNWFQYTAFFSIDGFFNLEFFYTILRATREPLIFYFEILLNHIKKRQKTLQNQRKFV